MMSTGDDEKEDLQWETVWTTMGMAGGPIVWFFMVGSFFFMQTFRKYTDFAQKNVDFGNSTVPVDGIDQQVSSFSPWDYFVQMMMLN